MKAYLSPLALMAVASLALTGCWEDPKLFPCETGSGAITTESRTVSGFTRIIIDVPADVYLHRDSSFSLDIKAQESLLEWIDTDVTGDLLEIRNDRCFTNTKTIRIDVYLPSIEGIEVVGSGDVYGLDAFASSKLDLEIRGSGSIELEASADEVTVTITGSGDADLSLDTDLMTSKITGSGDLLLDGDATVHSIKVEGSGEVQAFNLLTSETEIVISGSGDVEVHADSLLDVRIMGSGDVYYKGTPSLNVNISGSGEVINVN